MKSNELKALIVLHGMQTKELIEQLNISKSAFFRKINGNSEFTRNEIAKIAKIFNLSANEIYNIFFDEKCPKDTKGDDKQT